MFLGKLVVLVSCLIGAYMWFSYSDEFTGENSLFSILPLMIVIALFGFCVCSYVFAIYNVGVDTILLCFCQDCMIHENCGNSDTKLFHKGMQTKIKKITNAANAQEKQSKYNVKETELTEKLN